MEVPPHAEVQSIPSQGWGPVASILLAILAFIFGQAGGAILLIIVALASGHDLGQAGGAQSFLNDTSYVFLGNLLVSGSIFGLTCFFIKLGRSNLKQIGLKLLRFKDIGYALIGYLVYFLCYIAITVIVQSLAPHWLSQNQELGFDRTSQGLTLLPIFISLVVLPPLMEEVLFRGFLYTGLRKRLDIVWSTLVTSALFASAHLLGGETSALLWIAAVDTFILSLVLCQLRERTGSLWPSILLHGLKNFVAFGALFIFKIN